MQWGKKKPIQTIKANKLIKLNKTKPLNYYQSTTFRCEGVKYCSTCIYAKIIECEYDCILNMINIIYAVILYTTVNANMCPARTTNRDVCIQTKQQYSML